MNQKTTSKKPNSLEVLRKLIREEVKNAVREEMVPILLEVIKSKPSGQTSSFQQTATPLSNGIAAPVTPSANSGASSILEETRLEMMKNLNMPESQEYRSILSANTANMSMFGESSIIPTPEPVGSVDAMLNTARRGSKEESVEITTVPDFSHLMKKMNL